MKVIKVQLYFVFVSNFFKNRSKVYQIKGRLGAQTDNFTTRGRLLAKASYCNYKKEKRK
jgi:hypothetical protein